MRFTRSVWTLRDRREWTPRRIANARKVVQREQEKMALFPNMARYKSVEDRINEISRDDLKQTLFMRADAASKWREVRKAYFALPPRTREGMKRFWSESPCPAEAYYFAGIIREHLQTGFSPWSWLRFTKQLKLIGAGKLDRKHLNETFNQHQYGQYPWMKIGSGKHKKQVATK
jgi:hypothetical protein